MDEDFSSLIEELSKNIEQDKKKHGESVLLGKLLKEDNSSVQIENLETKVKHYRPSGLMGKTSCGDLVAVRPTGSEDTYVGIYLGEVAVDPNVYYRDKSKTLQVVAPSNPAIFVPKLKKVVFGYESWWKEIDSEDDLKQITDEDIENVWYVQAMQP